MQECHTFFCTKHNFGLKAAFTLGSGEEKDEIDNFISYRHIRIALFQIWRAVEFGLIHRVSFDFINTWTDHAFTGTCLNRNVFTVNPYFNFAEFCKRKLLSISSSLLTERLHYAYPAFISYQGLTHGVWCTCSAGASATKRLLLIKTS